jgi:hypothetical protein
VNNNERSDENTFEMLLQGNRIVVRGDLDDSARVLMTCRGILERIPKFSSLIIEANEARIVPEGVTTWIEAVEQFLMGCELTYEPSQLGTILQFDDRYPHPRSRYLSFQHTAA